MLLPDIIPNTKNVAEFLRLGCLSGLLPVTAAINWADSMIAAEPSPTAALIEVSLGRAYSRAGMASLLNAIPGNPVIGASLHMMFAWVHSRILAHQITVEDALLRLYRISSDRAVPEEASYELLAFEDQYALACDGVYGTVAEAEEKFVTFLAGFSDYGPFLPRVIG